MDWALESWKSITLVCVAERLEVDFAPISHFAENNHAAVADCLHSRSSSFLGYIVVLGFTGLGYINYWVIGRHYEIEFI